MVSIVKAISKVKITRESTGVQLETKDYMEKLFYPKSIAMIGAADKRIWQILGIKERNYEGDFYLVSRNDEEIKGTKCLQDISELPDEIDHVIIAVNRRKLKATINQCIRKKFHTLHLFTAGGSEYDEEGVEIEREVHEIIKNSDIRAIGTNCMGIYSPEGKVSYAPIFSEKVGSVAFVSHSGDLTTQFVVRVNHYGVYFSKAASIGNSVDLKISDFIEYFNSDEKTEIISVYFEGFTRFDDQEGRRLWKALKQNTKPLLFLRGGTTLQGKRAAASHTGTIASDDRIWDSVYKQTSALKVDSFDELVDTTMAFNYCKNLYPTSKTLILIGWSGGKAVLSTDQVVRLGIDVPEIREPTRSKMQEMISIGSVKNPLDLPWISREAKYPRICKLAISEDYVGGAILETGAPDTFDERFERNFENIVKIAEFAKKRKPFLISLPHSRFHRQREKYKNRLIQIGIPVFPSLIRAAKAFLNLYKYQKRFF